MLIPKTNLKQYLRFLIAPAIFCWCFFSLQGCKNPAIEDTDLLTSDDQLNLAKDTLHAKVFSEFEKPLNSNGMSVGVLGTLTDPNFGNTYAGFYAQCRLTSNNVDFGAGRTLDSAVLTLRYAGTYGKFDQPLNVSVYELSQSLIDSLTYKTNDAFSVNIPPVGTLTGWKPDTGNDSTHALNGTLPAHLRITLDYALGQKLLADTSLLHNNSQFLDLFKGFYITTSASTTGNGLAYLDLASAVSGITLFYHNDAADSLFYTLPIAGVTINHFDNIYTGTPVATSINTPNVNGEEKLYLQAGAGVKGKIFITDLDSLPKNIAINKAEIVITQTTDTLYPAPSLLDLYRIDDAGQAKVIDDDGLLGFGGVRTAETLTDGSVVYRYRFNFKKYFQKLIQGVYHNNGFYLETYSANNNAERVVISNSSTDKNYQITIQVIYTKL